jgi:hypothetical protein
MAIKYKSNNVIVNQLYTFGDASGSGSITFMKTFHLTFPDKDTVIAGLVEMNGSDAELLRYQANGIETFLRNEGQEVRDTVVNAWIKTSVSDSKLAGELVRWIGNLLLKVTEEQLNQLIQSARKVLIRNAELRKEFNKCFVDPNGSYCMTNKFQYINIEIPTEVVEIIKFEILEEQRIQSTLLQQAQFEKENLKRFLSSLSFYERVKYFQQNNSFKFQDSIRGCWNIHWGTCNDTELAQYSADAIQQLIDWCNGLSSMYYAIPQLHDRRHQLRQEAMNRIRENLRYFPVESWLNILIQIESIPIEHYPVELSKYATEEWFTSLEAEIREKIVDLLMGTKLKIWSKVVKRLTPPKNYKN